MASNNMNQTTSLNHQGKLGRDLPDTEEQLFQLSELPVFDLKFAQEFFKEDWEESLSAMLPVFLKTLPTEKTLIESAHANHNWGQIDKLAHKMKGGCLYMGTKRLAIACQYLERYLKAGHNKQVEKLYHQMITTMDETVPVLNAWLKTHH